MELKRKKRQKCIDIKLFYRKAQKLEYAAIITQLFVQSAEHMCLRTGWCLMNKMQN